jgi:signal transduction histidine kinase/PAS domain-containing protein
VAAFVQPEAASGSASDTQQTLIDLLHGLDSDLDLEAVFSRLADVLRGIFDIDRFAVVLRQDDGRLVVTKSLGLSPEYLARVQANIELGAGARALKRGRPKYIEDATRDPAYAPLEDAASHEGFRTVLILPLFAGRVALGYLILYHNDRRAYTEPEILLAQTVAQQAAIALQSRRLLAETESHRAALEREYADRVAEIEAIDDILLRISSSLDPESTLQAVVDAAASLSGAPYSAIFQINPDGSYIGMAAHGLSREALQAMAPARNSGLIGRVVDTRAPVQVDDYLARFPMSEETRQGVLNLGFRGIVAVPLLSATAVEGALYVAKQEAGNFPAGTIALLRRLAAFAQAAVRNSLRYYDVQTERARLQHYLDAVPEGMLVFDRDGFIAAVNQAFVRELRPQVSPVGVLCDALVRNPAEFCERQLVFLHDPSHLVERVVETGWKQIGLLDMHEPDGTFEVHYCPLRSESEEIEGVVATMRDISLPLQLGRERSRSHLLTQLLELSATLNSELSVPSLLERVTEAAIELVDACGGALGLVEGEYIVFRRYRNEGWHDIDARFGRGEGIPGRVWEAGEPYITNDAPSVGLMSPSLRPELEVIRLVDVPLVNREGNVVGALEVHDSPDERDFGRQDAEALQLLAHQAAIALENARFSSEKDAFLSVVSHELKTPVTSIKGFAQLLERKLSPESAAAGGRYLAVMNQQADRLASLINDLLDLSRIQRGQFVFETAPFDYSALVREVVGEMQLLAHGNDVSLHVEPGMCVLGNDDRLRQVLTNLIDNAIKYGPPSGTIHVTVEEQDASVRTCVQDEGPSLSSPEAEQIFKPYFQIRGTGGGSMRGIGLGLFVSRRIIEEHGGQIWLADGDSTTFCFTIPRAG